MPRSAPLDVAAGVALTTALYLVRAIVKNL
jgi:hypothetical protein